ncbi:MAG: diguanylate cyclase [Mariniblastus sp.]
MLNEETTSSGFITGQEFVDWKRLADAAPAMLWCINEEGLPVYYNQRWRSFAGISRETNLLDAWPERLHRDDIDWVMKISGDALKNRQSIRMEYRLRRHDGEYRQVLDMGEPQFDAKENFIGYIGSTIDITEQRRDAIALEKSHEQLNRTAAEIQLLNELNDNLQVCKNIEETRKILSRFGRKLFPDSSVAICLFSESRNIVEPFVSWGNAIAIAKMFAPEDCWALRRGKLHTETPCADGNICSNSGGCTKFGYACIPMMAYGEVIGVLNISFDSPQPESSSESFNDRSRINRLAQVCADQIALAIANLKLRESLQYQSTRDTLTRLYNRRYLMDNLEREFCRASQEGHSVSLLMLDIDHFKLFNDTYGHEAGDLVLREFGEMLKKAVRPSDIVCRYGGEEFVVVLLDIDSPEAVLTAQNICRRTEELIVSLRNVPLGKVTVSIGVAAFPQDAREIDPLLSCADLALYEAKRAGRNRVVKFKQLRATDSPAVQVPFVGGSNNGSTVSVDVPLPQ